MKVVEYRLPKEIDKSFIVFKEEGAFFPCPWHYHPEYELVLVNKSSGKRMVGDNIGSFSNGDLVLMGPGLPHVWVNDARFFKQQASNSAEAVVLHFLGDFLGSSLLQLPETAELKNVLNQSSRGLVIYGDAREEIARLMNEMIYQDGLKRISSLFSIFSILSKLKEFESLASLTYLEKTLQNYSDRFSKISEFVLRNYQREISLKEAADEVNMAVTTFCLFFKEHFRMTFIEYVNHIRIGRVCKLLAEKDHSIISAAYECGFNNLANFNRQFKRIKEMTPKEFRKAILMN